VESQVLLRSVNDAAVANSNRRKFILGGLLALAMIFIVTLAQSSGKGEVGAKTNDVDFKSADKPKDDSEGGSDFKSVDKAKDDSEDGSECELMDENGRFILDNSFASKDFASFLPGIGGAFGVPMWCFYVNRGQGVAAFGQTSKDFPLMEFYAANKAWQMTSDVGFRTYIRGERGHQSFSYQPFYSDVESELDGVTRTMYTGMNEFEIEEVNSKVGLQTNVVNWNIPNEAFPGLVRRATFKNIGKEDLSIELLDGLQILYPYGVTDAALTTIGRTLEAWMNVYGMDMDSTMPFYHLISSFADSEVVQMIKMGNYAFAFIESEDNIGDDGNYERLPFIVDPAVIYGNDTSLQSPDVFFSQSLSKTLETHQVTASKTPCGLYGAEFKLKQGEEITLVSVYGHANDQDQFTEVIVPKLSAPGYMDASRTAANQLTDSLTSTVTVESGSPIFDMYVKQNMLDNLLRGGIPIMLGDGNQTYPFHTYSRIHGDLERDYNYFVIAPTYYSNGPGNFRDVWQNRRNDVLQVPAVGDFNVRGFFSLIDYAGYNPMTVQAANFTIADPAVAAQVAQATGIQHTKTLEALTELFSGPGWLPGDIWQTIAQTGGTNMTVEGDPQAFLDYAVSQSDQTFNAVFTTGFWTDHWTYGLDLVDTYLMVFPDKEEELLFESEVTTFYGPSLVAPRSLKYVEFQGEARQIGSCYADPEKTAWAAKNGIWHLTADGEVMMLPVFTKILMLSTVRMAALDSQGMGLEMEGGKPGWLDALNGLPSFFGSSTPELSELTRQVKYLKEALGRIDQDVEVPEELSALMTAINSNLTALNAGELSDFQYWDNVYTAKETYREVTKLTFSGVKDTWSNADLIATLGAWEDKLAAGLQKAIDFNGGFVPTYFQWTATEYEYTEGEDDLGNPFVKVSAFEPTVLQKFLEGPVRYMKTLEADAKSEIYTAVKTSPIYDSVLQMFKISESLKELSPNVGRLAVFAAGWLENESVWLHMSYKFYLELLRGELWDEFWLEAKTGLCPFMEPSVYGRPLTEASSFIVSSANPDPNLWGQGFVSRLSGSTAEFLSMYNYMMSGPKPFSLDDDGNLQLTLAPVLPSWLFDEEENTISFTFLGAVSVTYHNPDMLNTWSIDSVDKIVLTMTDGSTTEVDGGVLGTDDATSVRNLEVTALDFYYASSS